MNTSHIFDKNVVFSFNLFDRTIGITDTIVMMWIIMAVIIAFAIIITRKFETVPVGKQLVAETLVGTVNDFIKNNLGHHWKKFAPYFGTLLLFILFSNIAGIFSILPTGEQLYSWTGIKIFENFNFKIVPPTKDLNLTATMALMTVLLIPIASISTKGLKGYLKGFLRPTPIMLPFNILDYATRTLSLSLRLFGNILAGYIIMEMLFEGSIFIKPIIPFASAFFDLFDAGLQAYIFVFLSSIYISEAIEE
ncbi:MAG: F0F1 ATP synthase subunit A [Oscillospiraceae bacterium]